jgi:hypothetical protein
MEKCEPEKLLLIEGLLPSTKFAAFHRTMRGALRRGIICCVDRVLAGHRCGRRTFIRSKW